MSQMMNEGGSVADLPEGAVQPENMHVEPGTGETGGEQPAEQVTNWLDSLPEGWRDELKDVSADDALDALKRGLGYKPAASIDDVTLTMPQDMQVDADVQKSFKQLCVDQGITPAQAQALVDFQIASNKEITDAIIADGQAKLTEAWGSRFEANRGVALKAVTALDRRMGGRLAEAMAASGMANNPTIVEAFYEIGRLISEDTLSGGTGASAPDRAETAEDTYKNMFKG